MTKSWYQTARMAQNKVQKNRKTVQFNKQIIIKMIIIIYNHQEMIKIVSNRTKIISNI